MLRHLRATNFAILSDVGIEFGPGLNVLTGETGAGKSLIVEAVNLLRGGRASADIPRAGAKEAVVEAIFEIPDDLAPSLERQLVDGGLPSGEGELLVRRIIARGGRSRTYINGALTTATRLSQIAQTLVDLSSQHQHQGLTDAKRHTALLDAFAADDKALVAMRGAFGRVREVRAELDRLSGSGGLEERVDFLRFQRDELEGAELADGEEEALEVERRRLGSADKLMRAAGSAEELLYGGDSSAADRIGGAEVELERIAALDPELAKALEPLAEARALIEDVAESLRAQVAALDVDPSRLEEVEERLVQLGRLMRKHGGSVGAAIERRDALVAELKTLENLDAAREEFEVELAQALKLAAKRAKALSSLRRKAAARLSSEVGDALAELGMPSAKLEVSLTEAPISERGADGVEILLRSNRGEDAKPLAKVASGGELSRIMLAIKMVLRRAEEVSCYVFDEVDSGIGGKAAEVVGGQIAAVSKSRQVLCVTHLAPIAAFADVHFKVEKTEKDERTETSVVRLESGALTEEIARMLGGSSITKSARAHAREMLAGARPR